MARAKKYKVKVLQTGPFGRPGDVIEVTKDTPHVDRWLALGVLEYVDEQQEAPDEGQADDGPAGDDPGEPGGGPEGDAPAG